MEARAIARHARLRSEKTNVETQRETTSAAVRRDGGRQKGLGRGLCPREKNVVRHSVKTERTKGAWGCLGSGGEEGRDKSEKPRGGANAQLSADVRMGQPAGERIPHSRRAGGERWELKHLSTAGGESNNDSPSSGERTGMVPKPAVSQGMCRVI